MPTTDLSSVTLFAVFVAGLATSLHCAGMCGLLTCGLGIAGHSSQTASIGIYHASRLLGYSIAGAIAGFLGTTLGVTSIFPNTNWLPLLLIVLLLAIALGLDKKIAAVPGLGKAVHFIRSKTLSIPPLARAGVVGLSTPLLPCGPLWAIMAIALASGSTIGGIKVMLVFGFGAIPAIWATQIASVWMNQKFNARQFQIVKRSLAVLAALSLCWHFWPTNGFASDEPSCNCEIEFPAPTEK